MDMKKIGAFIKELRKGHGYTQQELAERLNVSDRSVSRWETGTNLPDLSLLVQIADLFEVDVRELIDGERKNEKIKNEIDEAIKRITEYSNAAEKAFIRRIILVVVAGISAWCISLAMSLLFIENVTGGATVFFLTLLCVIIYSIIMFFGKNNVGHDEILKALIGEFIAVIAGNLITLAVFFGNGSYNNYGIIGVYYLCFIFFAVFSAAIITVKVTSKRKRKKE